jgi:aspartyl-tRNA(Asn)/glutamyl-tRNA(Gln) amidotransferase subunit A
MAESIKKIREGLLNKQFSAKELVQNYLEKIESKDKKLNSFLNIFDEKALSQAEKIDLTSSPLAGIPIALKDNILVEGEVSTAASNILKNYKSAYNATVVNKLEKAQAIIIGKTNLDEFACGSSGEHSAFGNTKNPYNLEYVPGGSSSGSAVAVAAELACCALGSDTAGSIRLPASFCNVVGFKPTYGAVSRYGLIAMASSLDQIGPIANSVEDIEIVFEIIKGKDKMDSTSLEIPKGEAKELKNLVIGLPKELFSKGIDKEILTLTDRAIKILEAEGVHFKELKMPHLKYGVACYYIIMPAELSSNLARYEGIKYGSSKEGEDLIDVYFKTRGEFLGKEIKRRIMLGTYVLSSGYYDAYYLRALKVRSKIIKDFEESFKEVDFILAPTSPFLPFKIGQKIDNPLSMYVADLLTVPANLAGLPAISLPAGKVNNLPIGIQLIAPVLQDEKLLKTAKIVEKLWTH